MMDGRPGYILFYFFTGASSTTHKRQQVVVGRRPWIQSSPSPRLADSFLPRGDDGWATGAALRSSSGISPATSIRQGTTSKLANGEVIRQAGFEVFS